MKKLLLSACIAALTGTTAFAENVTCEVKPSTGTISGTTWTSTSTPIVTFSLSGGAINRLGETETYEIATQSAARTVTVATTDQRYYVSAITMEVRALMYNGNPDVTTFAAQGAASVTATENAQQFSVNYSESDIAQFTITPSVAENKKAYIENVVVTLTPYTNPNIRSIEASLTNGTYNNGTGWSSVWTSNEGIVPSFTITASAPNMGRSNGIFDFRSGPSLSSTYTIASTSPYWRVAGFSFSAKMGDAYDQARSIELPGSEKVQLTQENQEFSATVEKGSAAVFYVKDANQSVLVSNLVATFERTTDAEAAAILLQTYNTTKQDFIAAINLWHPILGDELFNEKLTAFNNHQITDSTSPTSIEQGIESINSINAAWLAEANGRIIYLKNMRRSQANGKYLTANTNNDEANTKGSPVANSNWVVEVQGSTATFKLFNPEKNKYLGKANRDTGVPLVTSNNAAIFELNAVTTLTDGNAQYNGTAFHMINHNNNNYDLALNVNTSTDHLVTWNVVDGGSTWTIELAGVPASEISAGKYYRIRSARALAREDKRAEGSLLGVNTNVENGQAKGDVAIDPSKFSGLGTIWKIEESDVSGKYYIRNAATDFEGQDNLNLIGKGAMNANVSGNPGKFEFVSKSSNWKHKHPTAVIIKNQDGDYVDTASGAGSLSTWGQCNNDWPNNGGIYFFEEATDYEEIKEAYIATANETIGHKIEMQNKINEYASVPAFWNENDILKVQRKLDKFEELETSTTVASANSRRERIVPAIVEAINNTTIIEDLYVAAQNKPFIAWNYDRHGANNANYYLSCVDTCSYSEENEKYNVVGTSLDKTKLASIWTLEYQGNGKYYIKNYLNNRYAGFNGSNDHPFQTSETEGNLYEVLIYKANNNTIVGFKTGDWFMHQTNNGTKDYIVRWYAPSATNNQASGWFVASAEADEHAAELLAESTATRITFTVDGATLSKHEAYGDHHAITITKQPAEEQQETRAITEQPTTFFMGSEEQVKPYEDKFVVDYNGIDADPLEEGSYIITVPAAAFKTSDGKVTRSGLFTVTVGADGQVNTTGIENVVATEAKPAVEVIYDLQGRRVNRAGHGLYIINGRKVLVK